MTTEEASMAVAESVARRAILPNARAKTAIRSARLNRRILPIREDQTLVHPRAAEALLLAARPLEDG
jgi:hypothetical protein